MAIAVLTVFSASMAGLWASDVVFMDGKSLKNVKVKEEGEFITVTMPAGEIRFPKSAVKSIDKRLLHVPSPTPSPTPVPTPEPTPIPAEAEPAAPVEAATPSPEATVPEATPEPTPEATATPTPAPTPTPVPVVQKPTTEHRWNLEIVLIGLLVGGGVWLRSLQWVQSDLYERRADPRFWSMVGLFLPGVGALLYAGTAGVGDMLHRRRAANAAAVGTGPAGGATDAPAKFSWVMPPIDPAAHLASKGQTRKGFEFLDMERKAVQMKKGADINSGLDFASEMLEEALLERASDVHIEPTAEDYRVRFRLDGIMHERMTYDLDSGRRIVTALKSLAEIDIAEKRKAQDGRFRVRCAGREVDFRVATANSINGEKMVIRILDHEGGVFDLKSLGMSDAMLDVFQGVIHSRNGMILATGPTGSGKTSTLYAALRQLDASRLNIMTIEDPAEYELRGATQIAVNPKAGVTYASGLRSILRQDPDVIMVGEMRDAEAAQVALSAALTGHLVMSSLHTKDAIGTISRLQDMGIERYQVASGLLMVLAQRLVRVLCPHCRKASEATGDELQSIGMSFEPGQTIYSPVGCNECMGTGFRGRTGIFELLVLDDDLRRAVGAGVDEAGLAAMVEERGFKSYRYDGAEKILLGITTVEEVLQAG